MKVRKFQKSDAHALWRLHFQTIREFCIKDYSLAQVEAWAPEEYLPDGWLNRLQAINPFVAIVNGEIAGYADLQDDGYIDHFYCSKQHIGKGVGGYLMRHILSTADLKNIEQLYSHVSITAKPFFEHFEFKVKKSQIVNVRGIDMQNYLMVR